MKYYTLKEASSELGFLTVKAIRRRIERGTIQVVRRNGTVFITEPELERLKETQGRPEPSRVIQKARSILAGEGETREEYLERKVIDLESEVKEVTSLLNSYNQVGRVEDRLVRVIQDAVEKYPYAPRLSRPVSERSLESEHEMLLLVSDAHYPEVVSPSEAMGIEYGPEIVRRRMEYITERTLRLYELHQNNYPINKITIAVLGDMLSGNIHEELEITNALPMGKALTEMSYMLYDMGSLISEHVPEVEMVVMPGNHPRMTKKPRFKQKYDNFEYIMGQFVKALAKDEFVVTVPEDIVYAHDILGYTIGMMHGDGSKAASFAGIPFYGLKNRATAMQAMRSNLSLDRFDMVVMGHFHQMLNWTVGDCHVLINGAIKGGDEYSIVNYSSATDPVQALLTFHEDRGWINTERIPLENVV